MYKDLREWLSIVDRQSELKYLSGAGWDLEMAGLAELACHESKGIIPAILFDEVAGYAKGNRALFNWLASLRRLTMTMGIPLKNDNKLELVQECLHKIRGMSFIPPMLVGSGPVQENIDTGNDIDIYKFPIPRHHEFDGGRYIGTAHAVINQHPDTGWVNLGTYRCMAINRDTIALHMSPGRHGRIIKDLYFSRKQPMKLAIATGIDPALWLACSSPVPWGVSEYDYTGGMKGQPLEVIKGPYTGLPIPAHAEIVIEGECHPGELHPEGPFGEWAGYYANCGLKPVPEPVVHVKTVLHRRDPILTAAHPCKPPSDHSLAGSVFGSARMWDELEKAGVPGVTGVYMHEAITHIFRVVAIKQLYAGHARQAGAIAAQCAAGVYIGRYTVVVDNDIDPSNLEDVMWALATRSDPERSIDIMRRCRSSSADPAVPPDKKERSENPTDLFTSKAIIDACWPYEWKDRAYPVAQLSPQLREKLLQKWSGQLFG